MSSLRVLTALILLGSPILGAQTRPRAELPQPSNAPAEILAVIEISEGSSIKYEIDPEHDLLIVDRFLVMPVAYPANYGFLPSTLSGDGDALDVLVLTRAPVLPGAALVVRPVALLRTVDGGGRDDKVLAVPADDVDPGLVHLRDLGDLGTALLQRIEHFFRVYKQLPEGGQSMNVEGWKDASVARTAISSALRSFQASAQP